jgi:oligoribonuclease NrnB/cAMP/cGMP phosphodiesterase (DHH superfamily)
MSVITNFDYVIYHINCSDGISSAWVTSLVNDKAIKIGCIAGKNPANDIEIFRNNILLFCDISPTPEYTEELLRINAKIIVIDHHKAALDNIEKYSNSISIIRHDDKEKSGCILTWEYFFPDREIPWFLRYISDRDTWSWKLENSKEINAALFEDRHITQEGLEKLYNSSNQNEDRINISARGKSIEAFKKQITDKFVKAAIPCKYKDYNIWIYNCLPEYRSDVGNLLLNREITINDNKIKPDFSVSWYFNFPKEYWLSLRSDDTKVDVCEIAKEIASNGGGHRNAAGVTIDQSQFIEIFKPI